MVSPNGESHLLAIVSDDIGMAEAVVFWQPAVRVQVKDANGSAGISSADVLRRRRGNVDSIIVKSIINSDAHFIPA